MSSEAVTTSTRQQMIEWWIDHIEELEEFQLPVLAAQGAEELRQDAELCRRFLDEWLPRCMYDVGKSVLSERRGSVREEAPATGQPSRGQVRLTGQAAAEVIQPTQSTWSRWMEHDPQTGKQIRLFALTKEAALRCAVAREERAAPDLRRAALLRLAAGRLAPGQRIEEVWSPEELAAVEAQLVVSRPTYSLEKTTILGLMQGGEGNGKALRAG